MANAFEKKWVTPKESKKGLLGVRGPFQKILRVEQPFQKRVRGKRAITSARMGSFVSEKEISG